MWHETSIVRKVRFCFFELAAGFLSIRSKTSTILFLDQMMALRHATNKKSADLHVHIQPFCLCAADFLLQIQIKKLNTS
jgi:hypothetical protein